MWRSTWIRPPASSRRRLSGHPLSAAQSRRSRAYTKVRLPPVRHAVVAVQSGQPAAERHGSRATGSASPCLSAHAGASELEDGAATGDARHAGRARSGHEPPSQRAMRCRRASRPDRARRAHRSRGNVGVSLAAARRPSPPRTWLCGGDHPRQHRRAVVQQLLPLHGPVFCGDRDVSDMPKSSRSASRQESLQPAAARRFLPFTDTDAYRVLKVATEAFVMVNCGVFTGQRPFDDATRPGLLRRRDLRSRRIGLDRARQGLPGALR